MRILSLLPVFYKSKSSCNFNQGQQSALGNFPHLIGGDDYSCTVQGVILNWTSKIGASGICTHIGSGTSYSFVASFEEAMSSNIVDAKLYQDFESFLVCDSDSTSDPNISCIGSDTTGVLTLMSILKISLNILRGLTIADGTNACTANSSTGLSEQRTTPGHILRAENDKITFFRNYKKRHSLI